MSDTAVHSRDASPEHRRADQAASVRQKILGSDAHRVERQAQLDSIRVSDVARGLLLECLMFYIYVVFYPHYLF
ncbi:hypothetical protein Btru_007288 [Bulinus truncatus]|nr:hypothetical protein Btru_007288 [Bulinus truncatus]